MTSDLDLAEKSRQARIILLKSIFKAGSGHPAGSLGAVDILVAFYFRIPTIIPKSRIGPNGIDLFFPTVTFVRLGMLF